MPNYQNDRGSYGVSMSGDNVGVPLTPVVSGNAWYNLPSNFRTFTSGTGSSAGVSGRHFKVESGTDVFGYGTVQSFRSLNFKTGTSASIRMSAIFGTPAALTWTGAGAFSIGDEVSFGYNGLEFGIWHRYGGLAEVQVITVSGAAGGSENLTLTLNTVGYTIPLTAGTTIHNANEIADWLNANQSVWYAQQLGSTVVINALSDGAKDGTYTFSSSTATGSIAQTTAGVTKTSDHTPQSDWSGNVPSGFDPLKGNNYEIEYENGFGDMSFKIRDPDTNRYETCHVVKWSSSGTASNMLNPCLPVGCYATSIGATTSVSVECPFLTAFSEASETPTRNPRGFSNTKSISTTPTSIFALRVSRTYGGFINQAEVEPTFLTMANDGSKSAVFKLIGNPTLGGTPNFQAAGNNLITDIDTAGTTITGGLELVSFTVAKGQSLAVNLSELRIRLPPTIKLAVVGFMTSGAAADLTASLTRYEDVG